MKAIETRYKGYRFRSRLEARWAVFFDALGIRWQYEVEGFELPITWDPPPEYTPAQVRRYLPDFYLPQVDMWAEVKPLPFFGMEMLVCHVLAEETKKEVLLLDGIPDERTYFAAQGRSYNHGNWDFDFNIYDIAEGSRYWESEGRFYGLWEARLEAAPFFNGKGQPLEAEECDGDPELIRLAVKAARSARFEHGEMPCPR